MLLFWATILFSAWYVVYYHMGHGESVDQQYDCEMLALYDLRTKQLLKLGPITDTTINGFTAKPDMMASAKALFAQRCAVCHGRLAQGNIGPNLTDDYWLHAGRPTQIYKTITEPQVGNVSYFKVYSGTLRPGDDLINHANLNHERINQIFVSEGKNRESVNELKAGDLGVTVKLKASHTNTTLFESSLGGRPAAE